MYIVFEGLIGSGKTTQSKRLVDDLKNRFPDREVIWTREPGGCEIAEAIRTIAQATPFTEKMDPVCEAYLFASARAQSLRSTVAPVLARNGIVVADRSFASSVAWQGFGQGLGLDKILEINRPAIDNLLPDLIIELAMDPALAMSRTFDAKGDKFETMPLDFHERCAKCYQELAKHPLVSNIWKTIDAAGSKDEVYQKILTVASGLLGADSRA